MTRLSSSSTCVAALVLVCVALVATASPLSSSLTKRQLFKDTCSDSLGFTSPKQGDTWTTFSKVTVSWSKPLGNEYDPMSFQLMRRNTSDPMTANRMFTNSVFEINPNVPPTETSVTAEFKLPEGKSVEKGGDYFVRVMATKKGSTNGEYFCSPYFNVDIGKPSGAVAASKASLGLATAVAVAGVVGAMLM
ncbi:hypothetical protein BCR44DRAFT_70573 [Catenaria anguillulae PL171]|uniref:Ser-Thr-rich glycosyl-phosphatidyl-inositol-anchored membrane family-domain-containing protein n=1 Tax=Catenaria anguillulae PL171 TaxID=765915 RepID=A0A1Y2H9T2_9FUNG|nr:hypothetical protein BCR44DRAFT_70573 [Catenaria anguillulae PL171]